MLTGPGITQWIPLPFGPLGELRRDLTGFQLRLFQQYGDVARFRAGPLLMHSRLGDPEQKIMWGDEHWALLEGAGATVELVDGNVYLAMSLRNSGSGIGEWWKRR